jgi:hypothetical protein
VQRKIKKIKERKKGKEKMDLLRELESDDASHVRAALKNNLESTQELKNDVDTSGILLQLFRKVIQFSTDRVFLKLCLDILQKMTIQLTQFQNITIFMEENSFAGLSFPQTKALVNFTLQVLRRALEDKKELEHDEIFGNFQNSLARIMATLLEMTKHSHDARVFFVKSLRSSKTTVLFATYLISPKATDIQVETFQFLLPELLKHSMEAGTKYLQKLNELFLKRIQGNCSTTSLLDPNWDYYYENMNEMDWKAVISVALMKVVRKAPETSSKLLSHIISHLSNQNSADFLVVDGIIGLCLRIMKSEDFEVKNSGILLTVEIFKRTFEESVVFSVITSLLDSTSGKFPGVSVVSMPIETQKLGFFTALYRCICLSSKNWMGYATSKNVDLLTSLCTHLEKELDVNCRLILSATIGHYYDEVSEGSTQCEKIFIDKMKDLHSKMEKLPLKIPFLLILAVLFRKKPAHRGSLTQLAPMIDSVTKESSKKAGINYEGILGSILLLATEDQQSGKVSKGRAATISILSHCLNDSFKESLKKNCQIASSQQGSDFYHKGIVSPESSLHTGQVLLHQTLCNTVLQLFEILSSEELLILLPPVSCNFAQASSPSLLASTPSDAIQIIMFCVFRCDSESLARIASHLSQSLSVFQTLTGSLLRFFFAESAFPMNSEEFVAQQRRKQHLFGRTVKKLVIKVMKNANPDVSPDRNNSVFTLIMVLMSLKEICPTLQSAEQNLSRICSSGSFCQCIDLRNVAKSFIELNRTTNQFYRDAIQRACVTLANSRISSLLSDTFLVALCNILFCDTNDSELFQVSSDELNIYLNRETAILEKIAILQSQPKAETDAKKAADKPGEIDWAAKIKKDKGKQEPALINFEEVAGKEVEAIVRRIDLAVSQFFFNLELVSSFAFLNESALEYVSIEMLRSGFLWKCFSSKLLNSRLTDFLYPLFVAIFTSSFPPIVAL